MLHLLLIWKLKMCVVQKALKDWSNKSCGLEMLQFPRDPLALLSVPTPRVADNLMNRALSQAVGSDDLNLLTLVQDIFCNMWRKAVTHLVHSIRQFKEVLRYLVGRVHLNKEEGCIHWLSFAPVSTSFSLQILLSHPQKTLVILNNNVTGASNNNMWLANWDLPVGVHRKI